MRLPRKLKTAPPFARPSPVVLAKQPLILLSIRVTSADMLDTPPPYAYRTPPLPELTTDESCTLVLVRVSLPPLLNTAPPTAPPPPTALAEQPLIVLSTSVTSACWLYRPPPNAFALGVVPLPEKVAQSRTLVLVRVRLPPSTATAPPNPLALCPVAKAEQPLISPPTRVTLPLPT